MAKILVVDDEMGIRELLSEILSDEGHTVQLAENAAAARAARQAARPDLVLLDIWMPDTDGVTLLKEWGANGLLSMPVIMMSGHGTIDTAVEAIRVGALDFLEKPIALQKLLATVKRGLNRQPARTRAHLTLATFTRSTVLRDLKKRLDQVAAKSRTLLLRVGRGSITELCARSLQRPEGQWLDLGSLATPLELQALESLRGGLLFSENLHALTRPQQKNLVFALERLERYDLRLIVGCDASTEQLVGEGWDPQILKRLFEVSLVPPTIADLKDDIPELANQIVTHLADTGEIPPRSLTVGALNALRNVAWPGGIPELKATIRSLALASLEDEIDADEVTRLTHHHNALADTLPLHLPLREARETFERLYFEHHLQIEGGNITRLAEKTGLERTHLYRKLKQLGIALGRRSEG